MHSAAIAYTSLSIPHARSGDVQSNAGRRAQGRLGGISRTCGRVAAMPPVPRPSHRHSTYGARTGQAEDTHVMAIYAGNCAVDGEVGGAHLAKRGPPSQSRVSTEHAAACYITDRRADTREKARQASYAARRPLHPEYAFFMSWGVYPLPVPQVSTESIYRKVYQMERAERGRDAECAVASASFARGGGG